MNEARPLMVRIGVPERRGTSNAAVTVTRLDVYDDIGDSGWSGGLSAQEFVSQLSGIKGELDIHLNSGGGDVFDGIAIASAIRDHKGRVTTTVDGIAASIASVIAQAGQERVMAPGSMMMIHEASGVCQGDAAEMAKTAQTLDQVSANLASIYATRAGGQPASWRDAMKTESWYTAEQAVAAGLADRVSGDAAHLPAGLDVAAFTAAPGQIAARLREMPVAGPQGRQHAPHSGTHSHSHAAYGAPDADDDGEHSHPHSHDSDGSHSHTHGPAVSGSEGTPAGAAGQDCPTCKGTGKIMEGHRECPDCHGTGKKTAAKAAHGGTEITLSLAGGGSALSDELWAWLRENIRVRGVTGKPGTHGDHERFDPDGDGDCDACPEGDTDHDYWTPAGEQLKDVPGKPMEDKAPTLEDIRALIREEMAAGAPQFAGKIPDAVKTQFLKDLKNDSPVDIAAGMRRLSQWAASGHYPTGTTYDDLLWFYNQCAKELKSRDPESEAGGNFPPKKSDHLDMPLDAGGDPEIRNCHALVTALAAIKESAGGEGSSGQADGLPGDKDGSAPDGHGRRKLSGAHLEQIRAALKGAKL